LSYFLLLRSSPCSTLFPYTTLFRSQLHLGLGAGHAGLLRPVRAVLHPPAVLPGRRRRQLPGHRAAAAADRRRPAGGRPDLRPARSEEHTSELQSLAYLVCRLLLEKK